MSTGDISGTITLTPGGPSSEAQVGEGKLLEAEKSRVTVMLRDREMQANNQGISMHAEH